jgi:hypothetical protein
VKGFSLNLENPLRCSGFYPDFLQKAAMRDWQMEAVSNKTFLQKMHHTIGLDRLSPGARKIVVAVLGGTILLIGVALVFLPGPAFIVIPVGLAVLASEFAWARRWLDKARRVFKRKRKQNQ